MKFSDEMINAYADGELQGSEKAEFENALQEDVELQQAVACVNGIKAQLHNAYADVEVPERTPASPFANRMVAYSVLLMLVFTSGWIGGDLMHSKGSLSDTAFLSDGVTASAQVNGKFVLHVGTYDEARFKQALDEIESLLMTYQNEKQPIELEVIANAGGLNLFREDGSASARKVKAISQQYPNVRFIACSNAIERLRERGIEPKLINTVHKGPTALDQVVKRMNEGWTYIKI